MMRKVITLMFIVVFLSGFTLAVDSQITSDFSVNAQHKQVTNYTPQKNSTESYSTYYKYAVLLFVLLLLIYFIQKNNSKAKGKKHSKKKSLKKTRVKKK